MRKRRPRTEEHQAKINEKITGLHRTPEQLASIGKAQQRRRKIERFLEVREMLKKYPLRVIRRVGYMALHEDLNLVSDEDWASLLVKKKTKPKLPVFPGVID